MVKLSFVLPANSGLQSFQKDVDLLKCSNIAALADLVAKQLGVFPCEPLPIIYKAKIVSPGTNLNELAIKAEDKIYVIAHKSNKPKGGDLNHPPVMSPANKSPQLAAKPVLKEVTQAVFKEAGITSLKSSDKSGAPSGKVTSQVTENPQIKNLRQKYKQKLKNMKQMSSAIKELGEQTCLRLLEKHQGDAWEAAQEGQKLLNRSSQ